MAIVKKNIITKGLSGILGDSIVFRRVGGRTIVSTPPTSNNKPTPSQLVQRERFQHAVLYAKGQMTDPTTKAEYEAAAKGKGQPNAYNIAVADFFNAPNIEEVDVTLYTGAVNDIIRIRVTDDFKVKAVHVEIHNGDGTLVEEGEALIMANKIDWSYKATAINASLTGDRIIITAVDMPGNPAGWDQTI